MCGATKMHAAFSVRHCCVMTTNLMQGFYCKKKIKYMYDLPYHIQQCLYLHI